MTQSIERAELKAAKKKIRVHESGVSIAKIEFQRANFEQHSAGLETASVARELHDVYELQNAFRQQFRIANVQIIRMKQL